MGNESHDFLPDDPQPGPSWARSNWPAVGGTFEDDLTQAMDPTAMQAAIKAATKAAFIANRLKHSARPPLPK